MPHAWNHPAMTDGSLLQNGLLTYAIVAVAVIAGLAVYAAFSKKQNLFAFSHKKK